jgi:hypothetical protein
MKYLHYQAKKISEPLFEADLITVLVELNYSKMSKKQSLFRLFSLKPKLLPMMGQ